MKTKLFFRALVVTLCKGEHCQRGLKTDLDRVTIRK